MAVTAPSPSVCHTRQILKRKERGQLRILVEGAAGQEDVRFLSAFNLLTMTSAG